MQKTTLVLLTIASIFTLGCAKTSASTPTITPAYVLSHTATEGNHSHIWLGFNSGPDNNVNEILEVLAIFESNHPELEITDWKLNAIYKSYSYSGEVYGIWIDHKTKPRPVK